MVFSAQLNKVRRFIRVTREEGLGVALRKTRNYLAMRRAGCAPSTVMQHPASAVQAGLPYLGAFWQDMARLDAFHAVTAPSVRRQRPKVALIGDLNLPQCRKYRVEQLDDLFQLAGVDYAFSHFQDLPRCTAIMQDATHLMLYRLQSGPLTSAHLYEARRLRLPVLYDLDDPLFSVSAYETYGNMKGLPDAMKAHFLREAPGYLDAMAMADMISVSTPGMVEHASLYTPRPVVLRRNFADMQTLDAGHRAMAQREGDGLFRVAFASGSRGHEVDFAEIEADVVAFLRGAANRRLSIIGHFDATRLPRSVADRVEIHTFAGYDTYLRHLARADCAVMPLADDPFNRCKSAVRVLDACAVGLPAIVGQVGDLPNVVLHGETGQVVPSGASWLPALEAMATDAQRTRAMGQAARATLERDWTARLDRPVLDPAMLDWIKG